MVRHGETEWNRRGRYQGRLESSLTRLGMRQANAVAESLAACGIARVVSSPLTRCRETARAIEARTGAAATVDPRLIEIGHGSWEGRLRREVERNDAERLRAWRAKPETVEFPSGESLAAVARRWCAFAADIDGTGALAVVTHDVIVRVAILWAGDRSLSALWQPRVSNGGYAILRVEPDSRQLLEECRDAHLTGLVADASRQAL